MSADLHHLYLVDRGTGWGERWRAEMRTGIAHHAATGKTAAEAIGALVAAIVLIEGGVEILQITENR